MLAKSRRKMAVTGEAEVERQHCQVGAIAEKIECPGKTQTHLVAIKRNAFGLGKNLRQIDRRNANFTRDPGQCPAPTRVCGENELGPADQLFATITRDAGVRSVLPE